MSLINWERIVLLTGIIGSVAGVASLVNAMALNRQLNFTAEPEVTFVCLTSQDGVPTTVALTPRGKISLIRWVSDYFKESGFDPKIRCEEVSKRFQSYYNQGVLNYITTGIENGQAVVCVSGTDGGACNGTLFTLKSEASTSRVIQHLFDVAYAGVAPLEESSSSPRIYIDIRKLLGTAPTQSN